MEKHVMTRGVLSAPMLAGAIGQGMTFA